MILRLEIVLPTSAYAVTYCNIFSFYTTVGREIVSFYYFVSVEKVSFISCLLSGKFKVEQQNGKMESIYIENHGRILGSREPYLKK